MIITSFSLTAPMLILFHSLTVVVVFSLLFSRLMALKRMGIVDNYEVCVVKTP